jgi:hypothetical protein
VSTAEWAGNPARNHVATARSDGDAANGDLLAALAGGQAGQERVVAEKTRRVVMASLGVMEDQKAGRKRSRSLVLASVLLVLIAIGPFVWRLTDDLIGGELLNDMATQFSLWACILCPAVLAAVVVAGWSRIRS